MKKYNYQFTIEGTNITVKFNANDERHARSKAPFMLNMDWVQKAYKKAGLDAVDIRFKVIAI